MNKQWFVLHTLTGKEKKARASIEARVRLEHMEDYIGRCLIPEEKVTEKKEGKKRTIRRMFFPGYLLCEIALYDEAAELDDLGRRPIYERTWQFLRATPGVIGFVGVDPRSPYPQPAPMKQSEIDAILTNKPAGAAETARPKVEFTVGETVKVIEGAFMGLTGQVTVWDPDRGKLKVEVKIFNRMVQVDAESWQVEKAPIQEAYESLEK